MIASTTSGSTTGRFGPNASPVIDRSPSIVSRAVKNGKSVPKRSLWSTPYSTACTSAL